jgi:hypothetical protein
MALADEVHCMSPVLADIVAKVPNCSALIFLLLKNPTDDR